MSLAEVSMFFETFVKGEWHVAVSVLVTWRSD